MACRVSIGDRLLRLPAPWPSRVLYAGVDLAIERALGVRTRGGVTLEQAGISGPHRHWYTPTGWIALWRSMAVLDIQATDVLLDLGAGKGRVLVAADRFPFARIIGVELAPGMAQDARHNVARRASRRRSGPVEVVEADATTYRVPDDVTVVFMYAPFAGPLFAAAVEQIIASLDRRPRRLHLVYNNPHEHNALLATGRFRPVAVRSGRRQPPWDRQVPLEIVTYAALAAPDPRPYGDPNTVGGWAAPRDTSALIPRPSSRRTGRERAG